MPENKPMKMQWITVDGRQVPSILPNHWNEQKNDWDITGTKNPLPIANYTQNESGVWLPTSESNPMPTRVTGSKVSIISVNEDDTNSIPSGGSKTIEVKPPLGKLWRTPLIWANLPNVTGATTGDTRIEIKMGMNIYYYLVLRARSNVGSMTRIMANVAETATHSALPEEKTIQQRAIQNIVITNDYPLYVTYQNSTDAELTNKTDLRMIVYEEVITQ